MTQKLIETRGWWRPERFHVLAGVFATLLVAFPLQADPATPEAVYAIADTVRAWPDSSYNAAEMPDADKASIDAALTLSPEALDILVVSDNPRHRALAVHIADCRGDLERLRSWKHLLADENRGLPDAGFSPSGPSTRTDEGRIARYVVSGVPLFIEQVYRGAYSTWFGITAKRVDPICLDLDAEDYRVTAQTDLSRLVQPWVKRLQRARVASECSYELYPHCLSASPAEILDQIKALDPSLRWAVIVRAEEAQLLAAADADTLLAELPQATVQAIASGERLLTGDPAYAHPDSEAPLRARFLELVETDPPPSDPD